MALAERLKVRLLGEQRREGLALARAPVMGNLLDERAQVLLLPGGEGGSESHIVKRIARAGAGEAQGPIETRTKFG